MRSYVSDKQEMVILSASIILRFCSPSLVLRVPHSPHGVFVFLDVLNPNSMWLLDLNRGSSLYWGY